MMPWPSAGLTVCAARQVGEGGGAAEGQGRVGRQGGTRRCCQLPVSASREPLSWLPTWGWRAARGAPGRLYA
jgi:hypothetical protein